MCFICYIDIIKMVVQSYLTAVKMLYVFQQIHYCMLYIYTNILYLRLKIQPNSVRIRYFFADQFLVLWCHCHLLEMITNILYSVWKITPTLLEFNILADNFFSSPDPKGHVSYCHHLVSIVSFSHFNLLLRNHWAKWNQTWQECASGGPL